jgi:hypothetical protein
MMSDGMVVIPVVAFVAVPAEVGDPKNVAPAAVRKAVQKANINDATAPVIDVKLLSGNHAKCSVLGVVTLEQAVSDRLIRMAAPATVDAFVKARRDR